MIKFTVVESPYSGDIEANTLYAQRACLDCIRKNENPYASHLLFPQFLDENKPGERSCGINLGLEVGQAFYWAAIAKSAIMNFQVAFYVDRGWSPGMEAALEYWTDLGARCEIRRLEPKTAPNGSSQIRPGDE